MKITLFLSSLWLFIASLFSPAEKAYLNGTVTDGKDALIGATVVAKKDRQIVTGAKTDINGKYRLELEPGTYQVEFSYTGFITQRIEDVKVESGKDNLLDIVLESGAILDEVVVTNAKMKKSGEGFGALGAAPASASARVTDTRSESEKTVEPAMRKENRSQNCRTMKASKPRCKKEKLMAPGICPRAYSSGWYSQKSRDRL
ncbi:MAG: carboxypeptidase regulatory-like domain-containing protein [Lewinellaceae bacterium]|nr:carboxypeptidase regulatory-like domain-containing protein [Lewinellaceae bacterium]